jgi:hypothetical protein
LIFDESVLSQLLVCESADLGRLSLFCKAEVGELCTERCTLLDDSHERIEDSDKFANVLGILSRANAAKVNSLVRFCSEELMERVCGLLASPDVDDPLVPEIAQMYLEDYGGYCENARVYTKRYATGERPDEASLSFLEEEVEPIESEGLAMEPGQTILSQPGPVLRQDDDARSMRAIRDYDDQYPESLRAPIWRAPESEDEGDKDKLSDDSLPSSVTDDDDEYVSEIQLMTFHRTWPMQRRLDSHEQVRHRNLQLSSLA